jgi:hypothetical protein
MNFEQLDIIKPKEEEETIKSEGEIRNNLTSDTELSGKEKWEEYAKYLSKHGIEFKPDDELRKLSYGELQKYESEIRNKILVLETKLIDEKNEMPMVISVAAYDRLNKTKNPRNFLSFQEGN